MSLYPLKFKPILKELIWGGRKLETCLGKNLEGKTNIGESWELSGVSGNVSVVANGNLAGNSLQELVEIYMDELVGEKIFTRFGKEFPLLVKFIDANADLSIQVHPNDLQARKRHHAFGKTEIWYALDGNGQVKLVNGFERSTNRDELLSKLNDGTLTELLHYESVQKGDVFFVPANRVHTICAGNLVLEIQQTSDVTYRVYDYKRKDANGNERELHLDMALDVIDYSKVNNPKQDYMVEANKPSELVHCEYFTANVLQMNRKIIRDYYSFDSFAICICVEGAITIDGDSFEPVELKTGETVLLPASLGEISYNPLSDKARIIEVYIA
ncbi:MAG: class I mannose-6-phosphate isomerase [Prolixibacteraceae bacterium]|nr:class I mannose-6-phosphate isomerase [Prolixibacteraceae bacterium]MBN2650567.1 class I mannose-6-phosphate isomerase [Prolixibacteraceae bacterium]